MFFKHFCQFFVGGCSENFWFFHWLTCSQTSQSVNLFNTIFFNEIYYCTTDFILTFWTESLGVPSQEI